MSNLINFDFLDNLELESVEKASTKLGVMDKQPTGANIRLFPDGKVFPSPELVDKFELQYVNKGNPNQGNGFDVFSTKEWGQWPIHVKTQLVLIAAVSKSLGKVDLFASTRYDEEGKPKADVNVQGTSTFGKQLIEMLKDTYDQDFFADGRMFLDLEIKEDKPIKPANNGVYTIPKPITRGPNAGKLSYERRENIVLYPLIPVVPAEDTVEATEQPVVTDQAHAEDSVPVPEGMPTETTDNGQAEQPTSEAAAAQALFS